jgi:membrane-associated protein
MTLFNDLFEFVKTQYATFGYLIVPLSAYMENTVLLGLIFPGATLLILGGVVAAQGTLSLPVVILLGWLGMWLGCCTDYWIGRAGLWRLLEKTRFKKWLDPGLAEATVILEERGGRAIFLAHFLGQIRTFVALTAGVIHFPFRKFALYELAATFVWSIIYCSAGYLVGDSLDSIQNFFKLMGVVVAALAFVGYLYWRKRRNRQLEAELQSQKAIRPADLDPDQSLDPVGTGKPHD